MYPNPPRGRGYEADQYERENEERMGQLHNRISNLKNVSRRPFHSCGAQYLIFMVPHTSGCSLRFLMCSECTITAQARFNPKAAQS